MIVIRKGAAIGPVLVKITLAEIDQANCCETPELQRRVQDIAKSDKTTCYRALCGGREVAFVALDRWPELDQIVLYELFVLKHLRRQGFGRAVLSEVECAALREGFLAVRLSPRPLDYDISAQTLIEWYRRHGYQIDPSVPSEMEKRISIPSR